VIITTVSVALLLLGAFFFVAGTIGLLRFPDVFSRLHALTKADNLGLGCIALALALQQGSLLDAAKLLGIWLLALLGSSSTCYLLGGHASARTRTEREEGR
jgi:multicomponent Na+:H+ antiporter subunit G